MSYGGTRMIRSNKIDRLKAVMGLAKEFLRFNGHHQAYNILEGNLKGDSDETSNR